MKAHAAKTAEPSPLLTAAFVAVGSGLGGGLRALLAEIGPIAEPGDFPVVILFINLAGSALAGVFLALSQRCRGWIPTSEARHFLLTGILGGFTTFSFFSLQSLWLLQGGHVTDALLYGGFTLCGGVAAAWGGHRLARLASLS